MTEETYHATVTQFFLSRSLEEAENMKRMRPRLLCLVDKETVLSFIRIYSLKYVVP